MLSIAIEAASGRSYFDLVQERVLDPAGMTDTGFVRSDRLPPGAAIGYLEDGRSNVLHLPVRGAGDGGVYSTVRDLEALWRALFEGRILPLPVVDRLVEPRNDDPSEAAGTGWASGFAPTATPSCSRAWTPDLVPDGPRPPVGLRLHGDLQHVVGGVAARHVPGRPAARARRMIPPRPVLQVVWAVHQALRRASGGRSGRARRAATGSGRSSSTRWDGDPGSPA